MDAVLHAYYMRTRGNEYRFMDITMYTERTLTQTCQLQKFPEDNVLNTQHPLSDETSKRNLTISSSGKEVCEYSTKHCRTSMEHLWNRYTGNPDVARDAKSTRVNNDKQVYNKRTSKLQI